MVMWFTGKFDSMALWNHNMLAFQSSQWTGFEEHFATLQKSSAVFHKYVVHKSNEGYDYTVFIMLLLKYLDLEKMFFFKWILKFNWRKRSTAEPNIFTWFTDILLLLKPSRLAYVRFSCLRLCAHWYLITPCSQLSKLSPVRETEIL